MLFMYSTSLLLSSIFYRVRQVVLSQPTQEQPLRLELAERDQNFRLGMGIVRVYSVHTPPKQTRPRSRRSPLQVMRVCHRIDAAGKQARREQLLFANTLIIITNTTTQDSTRIEEEKKKKFSLSSQHKKS